jgi:hypothetical protein
LSVAELLALGHVDAADHDRVSIGLVEGTDRRHVGAAVRTDAREARERLVLQVLELGLGEGRALTAAGRELLRDLRAVAKRSQADFLSALSKSERETLLALLRKVLVASDEARLAN